MVAKNVAEAADKPKFEPSDLIEYGDAGELTRGPNPANRVGDADTYTS